MWLILGILFLILIFNMRVSTLLLIVAVVFALYMVSGGSEHKTHQEVQAVGFKGVPVQSAYVTQ